MLRVRFISTSWAAVFRWMPQNTFDETLFQVLAWCRQAPSHYLSQCWPRSRSLYGVISPQEGPYGKRNRCVSTCPFFWNETLNSRLFTHLSRDKMANSLHTFSNVLSWMKIFLLWFKYHWNSLPMVQLKMIQHHFRKWLGANQVTSHYLNQWWPSFVMHICFNVS